MGDASGRTSPRAACRAAALLAALAPACALAQTVPPAPRVAPLPLPAAFREAIARGTRTADGRPGPAYWQQRADYRITASLDPAAGRVSASETISYRNGSPDTLTALVLHVEQNVFAPGARRNRRAPVTGGLELGEVRVDGTPVAVSHPGGGYTEALTLLAVPLPAPLPPGGTARLDASWAFTVPPAPTFRTGNLDGEVFAVAQWYPRVAVYDDVYGWNATPYLGDGEFYLEYGDFDVQLTLPAGWLVGATGTLENATEVLSTEAARRLAGAPTAAGKVEVVDRTMRARGEVTRAGADSLVWRFSARDVRDFAWSASPAYVWDALALGDGKLAQALYRPRFAAWRRAAEFAAFTIRSLSERLAQYPWPQVTITEGPVGGMEYPMLVFNPGTNDERALAGVTLHETAHQWFPMLVGSMEAKHAWMDEGLVTWFEETLLAELLGEPPPRWGETASYLRVAGSEAEVPLMRHTDLVSPYGARTLAAYTKPAVVMGALREVVGESVFDLAFRDYAESWSYRHPQPWDFFHIFERHARMDLDWLWRPLFFETATLDHGIAEVSVREGRTVVRLVDEGGVVLPATVRVVFADGSVRTERVGRETWLRARETRLVFPGEATEVVLDPDGLLPDVDRSDNEWRRR